MTSVGRRISKALDITDVKGMTNRTEYNDRIREARLVVYGILGVSALVFLAIVAFAIYKEGTGNLLAALYSVNPFWLLAAFGSIFVSYCMRFPKWEQYLQKLKVHVPRRKNFMVYMSMYSMDITPGRWGRGIASFTINRLTGAEFGKTFPAVVADIFTDFLGFVVLTLVTAPVFYLSITSSPTLLKSFVNTFTLVFIFLILLLLPFAFIYSRRAFKWFRRRLGNVKIFKSIFEGGDLYYRSIKRLDASVYVYSMFITIPSMFLNGLALYFVILSFGINLGVSYIPAVLFIFSSSLIIGIVTGLPATLGVTDFLLLGYLTLFFPVIGISTAALITIFFRIASVWFVEVFGFTALAYTTRYWKD
jgi:glycosyltransferase 2 family protein